MRRIIACALGLALLLPAACQRARRLPPARVPTVKEVSPETVVDNYGPQRLRVFPDRSSAGEWRYVIIASEHPELPAVWRPLGVSEKHAPREFRARAGDLAWAAGHVVAAGLAAGKAELLVYDLDGKSAIHRALEPPIPCTVDRPPLVQAFGALVFALLGCRAQDRGVVFTADADGTVRQTRVFPWAGDAELFLHGDDADYAVAGRRVLRLGFDDQQTIGTVPPPQGGPDTRDLLRGGRELYVVDGAAGRVIVMEPRTLRWQKELHFPVGAVERLRAVLTEGHMVVVAAERAGSGTQLYGIPIHFSDGKGEPERLALGAGSAPSDHELVPVGLGGALLVRTHQGNTGPLVALTKLLF